MSNDTTSTPAIVAATAAGPGERWRLLLASFLSLFVELILIRWIPSNLHIIGFFSNLILIACFLGLGIGMARPFAASQAVWRAFFRVAVMAALLLLLNMVNTGAVLADNGDYGVNEVAANQPVRLPAWGLVIAVFAVATWTMVPFGQLVAAHFDCLERIPAYSLNIAGSLLGVLTFSLAAWLEYPPMVWFAGGMALLWLLDRQRKHALPSLLILVVLGAQYLHDSARFQKRVYWSPYYKVVVHPIDNGERGLDGGFLAAVNDQFLLSGLDLRPEATLAGSSDAEDVRQISMLKSYYNFPFQLRQAKRVLVLGAGAGNDVAAALRHGAEHVTAVEIDPVILRLGRRHHPERPYESDRVRAVLDDARAFLNRTDEKFDLIVFATLDAHGLLSSMANVRLDSFIYTKESLAAARRHLTDDGLLALSFGPFREEVLTRQYATVRSIFGAEPLYFQHQNGHRTIVAGALDGLRLQELPSEWRRLGGDEIASLLRRYPDALTPPTDDWPHLYLREPRVPREYVGVLAGVLLLSVLLVGLNFRGAYRLDGHFFFLGAGFLLLETKSVTEFALLVGSTWQVNALVFVVILLMILLANLVVLSLLKRVSVMLCYLLLAAGLLASYFWPVGYWADGGGALAYALAAAYLAVPIFMAGMIFAFTFRSARLGSLALASNLLGAVLGGTAEYLSLAYGIRSLSLLALAMYGGSLLCWLLRRGAPSKVLKSSRSVSFVEKPTVPGFAQGD
jgi:hypothetical protein